MKLQIEGIKNPNTMEETDSFSLTTRTATRDVIDETDTGLVVQVVDAADILIEQLSVFSNTVGATNMLTFKLVLPTTYQSGGYLTVALPSTMSVASGFLECFLHIGFESDQGFCNVPSDNVIKIYDNIKQTSLTFTISGIVNPPNTKPTETFVVRCFDPFGNEIGHSENQTPVVIEPVPGTIKFPSVLRPDPTVGAIAAPDSNEFKFSFSSQN